MLGLNWNMVCRLLFLSSYCVGMKFRLDSRVMVMLSRVIVFYLFIIRVLCGMGFIISGFSELCLCLLVVLFSVVVSVL